MEATRKKMVMVQQVKAMTCGRKRAFNDKSSTVDPGLTVAVTSLPSELGLSIERLKVMPALD